MNSFVIFLVIAVVGIKGMVIYLTTGPPVEGREIKAKRGLFHQLAAEMIKDPDKFDAHPVYHTGTLTVVNPFNEGLGVTRQFVVDTGSSYFVISRGTFEALDLVAVGVCNVAHLTAAE